MSSSRQKLSQALLGDKAIKSLQSSFNQSNYFFLAKMRNFMWGIEEILIFR
jgi:hypothetical protein